MGIRLAQLPLASQGSLDSMKMKRHPGASIDKRKGRSSEEAEWRCLFQPLPVYPVACPPSRHARASPVLSSFRCRALFLGHNFTFLRSLPIVAQQPPCPLLYATPSSSPTLADLTSLASGGSDNWGSGFATGEAVTQQAEWGKGDCVDGWAVMQVEEMGRAGGETEMGESSGREDGRGSITGLQRGEKSSSVAVDDPLKVIAIVFPQVGKESSMPLLVAGELELLGLTSLALAI